MAICRSCSLLFVLLAGCTTPELPLPGPVNERVQGALDEGVAPRDLALDLVLGVALRHPQRLDRFLERQPETRDALRPDDFAHEFAITPVEYDDLVRALGGRGLAVTRRSPSRTTLSVHGTVQAIEEALGTSIHAYEDADGRFFAAATPVRLGWEINAIGGIIGLEGGRGFRPRLVQPEAFIKTAATTPAWGAAAIAGRYGTTGIAEPGKGETVVILGTGLPPSGVETDAYMMGEKPYGLTGFPGSYTVEMVGGKNRDDAVLAANEQTENVLDLEMLLATAPYAAIIQVLTATNSPGLFADGISYVVNQHPEAHQVTVSYGTCERGAAPTMPVMNELFRQAKAEGQTWFFAAGDTGTDACRDGKGNRIISAGWPASSPHVIAVGGTQIDATDKEVPWNSWGDTCPPSLCGSGGGGPSESMAKPAYQEGTTPADGARDTPDVAALAGPPFIQFYLSSTKKTYVAGTSAAAPMWAGFWALLEQGKGHAVITNAQERLYQLGASKAAAAAFHDVVSGNLGGPADTVAGGYAAAPGFDLATGWGSPNVQSLISNW